MYETGIPCFFVTKATCSWTFTEGARITRKIGTNTKDKGDTMMRDVPEGTWEAVTITKSKYVYCWIFQSLYFGKEIRTMAKIDWLIGV